LGWVRFICRHSSAIELASGLEKPEEVLNPRAILRAKILETDEGLLHGVKRA